ncbi:MAG: rane protein of unknown function [Candidatus Saccharibacteria bacterium]|nr:rane protein of unknown function [Candidatus Saccharibacteria bacterium]
MVVKPSKLTVLDKLFVGILLVIFGGIILHAPLSVGLGTLFPSADVLIKSWKEVLMLLAGLLMLVILYQKKEWKVLKSPLILVIAGYGLLHLLLLLVFPQGLTAVIAGLFIDLRYLIFFVLVYVAIYLFPTLRRPFMTTFFVGAFIVAAFALLQVFVLPHDILKYIGYNTSTIAPYLTVDQNPQYIRINSTLRGPNPLGAYAGIVLALVFAAWLRLKQTKPQRQRLAMSVIVIGSFVALWASYSRSAVFAAVAAIGIIVLATVGRKVSRKFWIILMIIIFAAAGALIAGRDTNFVSNVLLHQNASTGASVNSNQGHVESLQEGVDRMVLQPLGGGIGSTGSASLYGTQPLIVENQFLFIAHEAGWLGLILFVYITFLVQRGLWRRRADWLALSVFASGIGLILIGLLLPVWVDDTVAIIWWGLAAVALNPMSGKDSNGRTINKATKRAA